MRHLALYVLLFAAIASCAGRVTTEGGSAQSGDGGQAAEDGGSLGPSVDAADASPPTSGGDDAPVAFDASAEAAPQPISCGGFCGQASSSAISSLSMIAGAWSMCGGQLALATSMSGGFPADTAGFEIDATSGTAYLLVPDGSGSLTRGIGPQYQWTVALNTPVSSADPNITVLNFTSTFSNGLVPYDVTYSPAAGGCAALHLTCEGSGLPQYQSDFVTSAVTSGGEDASPPVTPDASSEAAPQPNGCGGVCSGQTLASVTVSSISMIAGTWSMCGGALAVATSMSGGFPPDTAGFEIDATSNTAYLLVEGDAGSLTRGVGPQYVWTVALNYPVSSANPVLNFSSTFSSGLVPYVVTYFPAADGCSSALHLTCIGSGSPQYQSDFVSSSPPSGQQDASPPIASDASSASSCGGVCSGQTLSSAMISSMSVIAGSWSLCAGQLIVASSMSGGFPADTAGFQIDATSNTAYLLVQGDAGALTRGIGPQYVWAVALNYPVSSGNPNETVLNFTSTFSNGLVPYAVTYFPAVDGCSSALHLTSIGSGLPLDQSDFVPTGP